jgi:hypothetical protein
MQPPGHMHLVARERKERTLAVEQAAAKANWPVEKNGDVDHQIKMVKVEGMRVLVEKNKFNVFLFQIEVIEKMKDVYVRMMGQEKYDEQFIALMNKMPRMERLNNLSILAAPGTQETQRFVSM